MTISSKTAPATTLGVQMVARAARSLRTAGAPLERVADSLRLLLLTMDWLRQGA